VGGWGYLKNDDQADHCYVIGSLGCYNFIWDLRCSFFLNRRFSLMKDVDKLLTEHTPA
jgi:hypothetical protein